MLAEHIHLLSTDPFRALESIFLVLRKDPMSLPREESSRSCNARSTGLNYVIETDSVLH